jgi:hypothetical protein
VIACDRTAPLAEIVVVCVRCGRVEKEATSISVEREQGAPDRAEDTRRKERSSSCKLESFRCTHSTKVAVEVEVAYCSNRQEPRTEEAK